MTEVLPVETAYDISIEVGSERPVQGVWFDILHVDGQGEGPFNTCYVMAPVLAQQLAERTVSALARAGELNLPAILAAARAGAKGAS